MSTLKEISLLYFTGQLMEVSWPSETRIPLNTLNNHPCVLKCLFLLKDYMKIGSIVLLIIFLWSLLQLKIISRSFAKDPSGVRNYDSRLFNLADCWEISCNSRFSVCWFLVRMFLSACCTHIEKCQQYACSFDIFVLYVLCCSIWRKYLLVRSFIDVIVHLRVTVL